MLSEVALNEQLKKDFGVDLDSASKEQIHDSLAALVQEEVVRKSDESLSKNIDKKTINYVSIEFLIGNCLENNLWNMEWLDKADKILKKHGTNIEEIIKVENDAGLGNGGLGRLAACFLESLATMGYSAMGHSLLYRYGLFRQQLINGEQREFADEWLSRGHFFLDEKKDKAVKVYFDGKIEEFVDYFGVYHYSAKDAICVEAVPYDLTDKNKE